MNIELRLAALLALMSIGFSPVALAQNTSSVSSPVVDAGKREVGLRFGWTPDENGIGNKYGYRFDYGMSLGSRHYLKLYASAKSSDSEHFRFTDINAEYLMELTPETARTWQSGVRFDARLSEGSNANRLRVDWLNRFRLSDRVSMRVMALVSRKFTSGVDDSVAIELRSSVGYRLEGGYSADLLAFVKLGTLDHPGLAGLPQQIGPTISGPIGERWKWTAGNLFGVSDAAPDNDVRVWISRKF